MRNPSPASDAPPGKPPLPVIPDHEILYQIGSGAYGEVWLARNAIGILRAVKIVWRVNFKSDRPYEREFSGMLKFEPISRSHEGFVDILHVGRNHEAGYFYYVMELADDAGQSTGAGNPPAGTYRPRTLSSEARAAGRLPAADCIRHFLTLTAALDALHRAGLIHRDIKPSNIIIVGGVAKLADIGLVTSMDSERSFVGTEGFIPPEGPGTAQADIYSLGKVLYEVATGNDRMDFPSLPYNSSTGQTDEDLLELNAVLTKACNTEAGERYKSAGEMQADLALLQSGRSIKQMRATERKLRLALRAGQFATVLAVLGFLLAIFYNHQSRVEKENLRRSEQLRHEREVALVEADLARASAERLSGRVGRRAAALSALARATELGGSSEALRSEAVASLALTDLVFEREIPEPAIVVTVQHALSPDLKLRAVTMTNGDISIRRTIDDRETSRLPGDGQPAKWVGPFSPDGQKLALYTSTGDIVVRDLAQGTMLLRLTNEPAWNSSADPGWWVPRGFSPDSQQYAVVHGGSRLTLHNLAEGTSREFTVPREIFTLAFGANGKTIALGARTTTNQIAFLNTGSGEVRLLNLPAPNGVYSLAWDAAGKQLAVGAGDYRIYVLDLGRSREIWRALAGHQQAPVALAFHPGGRLLISSGWDSTTRLWDVARAEELAKTERWGWDFIFNPDGRLLSYYNAEVGSLRFYSIIDQAVCREVKGPPGQDLNQVVFAPDSSWIGLAGRDNLRFFDTATTREVAAWRGETKAVVLLKGKPPEDFSLLAVHGGRLENWPLKKAGSAWQIGPRPTVESPKTGVLWNSLGNDTYGIDIPEDGFWVGKPGSALCRMERSKPWRRFALSPDGRLAAAVGFLHDDPEHSVLVWDAATGKTVWSHHTPSRGDSVFSPDSKHLAVTCLDGVSVWDLSSGNLVWRVQKSGSENSKDCAAWSPDGRLLAFTFTRLQTALIDAVTGEIITQLQHPAPGVINSLAFSPDSTQLATACESGEVQLWDLRALRHELAGLKLDWNHPPIPPPATNRPPVRIEVPLTAE